MTHAAQPPCPTCGSDMRELVYGYPTPEQLMAVDFGKAMLAGPRPYASMATHFCDACECYFDLGNPSVEEEALQHCHYCGESIPLRERLVYEMAEEEFFDPDDADQRLRLSGTAREHRPLPTCHTCLADIDELEKENAAEQTAIDRSATRARKGLFWFGIAVLAIALALELLVGIRAGGR